MESSNVKISSNYVKEIILTYVADGSLEGVETRLYGIVNPEMLDAISGSKFYPTIKVNSRRFLEADLASETIDLATSKVKEGYSAAVQLRKLQLESLNLSIGLITVFNSFGDNKLIYIEGMQKISPV